MRGREYIRQNAVCPDCSRVPTKQQDGRIRCDCPEKNWRLPNPIRADIETEALLRQKGFPLAPCGWYYYSGPAMLTIYENGDWRLEGFEQSTTASLIEYLSSLPDVD
jgi:hypothetical protein